MELGFVYQKFLRLGVYEKVFEWLAVNEFFSNSTEFFHANSKNYLRYLHFLFLYFLYVFFLLMKILNTSAWRKIH